MEITVSQLMSGPAAACFLAQETILSLLTFKKRQFQMGRDIPLLQRDSRIPSDFKPLILSEPGVAMYQPCGLDMSDTEE